MNGWYQLLLIVVATVIPIILLVGVVRFFLRKQSIGEIEWKITFVQMRLVRRELEQATLFLVGIGQSMLKMIFSYSISLVKWLGAMTRMVVILLSLGAFVVLVIAGAITAFLIEPAYGASFVAAVVFLTVVMLLLSVRQVGSSRIPAYAILTSWGRPKEAVGTGWIVRPPWVGKREFPAGQFAFQFVVKAMTKGKDELAAVLIEITVSVFVRWPDPEKEYTAYDGEKKKVSLWGEELLIERAFYAAPVDNLATAEGKETFQNYIEGSVLAAFRHAVSDMSYTECNEGQRELEEEVKRELLDEPGNPLHEMGIPVETLDVGIESIDFPSEIERILRLEDTARREAEETMIRAEGDAEATKTQASGDAEAIRVRGESQAVADGAMARALSEKGVKVIPAVVTKLGGILASGRKGE